MDRPKSLISMDENQPEVPVIKLKPLKPYHQEVLLNLAVLEQARALNATFLRATTIDVDRTSLKLLMDHQLVERDKYLTAYRETRLTKITLTDAGREYVNQKFPTQLATEIDWLEWGLAAKNVEETRRLTLYETIKRKLPTALSVSVATVNKKDNFWDSWQVAFTLDDVKYTIQTPWNDSQYYISCYWLQLTESNLNESLRTLKKVASLLPIVRDHVVALPDVQDFLPKPENDFDDADKTD